MEKTNPSPATVPFALHRQIGATLYKVGIHFNADAKETLDEKVRRLLKNDLQSSPHDAKIESLQAGWLPKGVHYEQ